MTYSDKAEKILYGGDYNPEQWEESVWEEDMRLFALAGIDIVTLNVFNWAALQKDEESYSFDRLDKIMDLVKKNGLKVCLATSTGAHPAWMAKRYPDILRTEADGKKRSLGAGIIPAPIAPHTGNIRYVWQGNWLKGIRIMRILWHGIYPMNTEGSAIAGSVRRHSGNG